MTEKPTYSLCDACHRPLRQGDPQRIIQGYQLHLTDECFDMYLMKVNKGVLKVAFTSKKIAK